MPGRDDRPACVGKQRIACFFVLGGLAGGLVGVALAKRLAPSRAVLSRLFAAMVAGVGAYILWRTIPAFFG